MIPAYYSDRKERKRKTPLFFGVSYRLILIIAAACMALSYIAVYVNPSKFAVPLFFGLYFIPILIINFILLLIALIWRSKSAWIPIVVLLPSLLYAESFFKIANNKEIQREGIKLKIETYNTGMFSSSRQAHSRTFVIKMIERQVKRNNPDIVCLQEAFLENKDQVREVFPDYKYRVYHLFHVKNGHYFGNIILSKFKINDGGRISFHRSTNLAIYADIDHYGKMIRIYDNHLESYNVSFTSLVQRLGHERRSNQEEFTSDLINVHAKVKGTVIRRSNQVNIIAGHIKRSPYPAIICGDFNDTPMSYAYHMLSKDRKDSFRESGKGFAATFSYLWPLLRIDYVLFPADFESISHTTIKSSMSDHFPVVAELII
jgi:endonuclease/exonuclease/phosphatase family metal-dependent hydrolase